MSKKSLIIAGVVVAIVLVAAGVWLIMPHGNSAGSVAGTAGSTTATGTSSTQSTTTSGTTGTSTTGQTGTSTSGNTGSSSSSNGSSTTKRPNTGPLKPYPTIDVGSMAAQPPSSTVPAGKKLPPLTAAPPSTISALKIGLVRNESQYSITMRPYGIGPLSVLGSRIAIKIDAVAPIGTAYPKSYIDNANLLALADTTNGGGITEGGTYTAVITWRSDGSKLIPVMSKCVLK